MKTYLVCLVLSAAPHLAAVAPDSLAGRIFRDYVRLKNDHAAWEDTIVLQNDGRFVFLKTAGANSLAPTPGDFRVTLLPPPGDGNYTYARSGETSGSLTLNFDGGTQREWLLTFSTPTAGTTMTVAPNDGVAIFYLTDLAAADSAPMLNVSLRGRVAPGRPLIAGVIVPGGTERELMIRAVGPGLAAFNVNDRWATPDFQIYRGSAPAVLPEKHNSGPGGSAVQKVSAFLGAFPLVATGTDVADIVRLAPGAYTVVCAPAANDPGGEVLVEIYVLP